MGKILLLEDNIACRKQLIKIASKINPALTFFETSQAGKAYSYSMENDVRVFLLDIQVEDFSGLELAKRLRNIKRYQFTPIIFITAMPTRELEAFRQIHCYDYIIKPFTEKEIEKVFQKILLDYVEETQNIKLKLTFRSFTQLIDMQDIVYVEYLSRKIVITTKNDIIEYIHMPLKKFKQNLDGDFLQIHQSVIINLDFLEKVEIPSQKIKMRGIEEKLPIGRSFIKEIEEKINELF